MALLIGYDLGSSSVKVSLVDADSGALIATASSPDYELEISSPHPGWAEQNPDVWWEHAVSATQKVLSKSNVKKESIVAIGIAYQMHGLVLVDKDLNPIRPSIIWCDSRAVEIGEHAFQQVGEQYCIDNLLNSPGNFTASKLKWVLDNEPEMVKRIYKVMLPGDFLAMKMTGEVTTTVSGLSEGVLWDYKNNSLSKKLLDYYGIDEKIIADTVPTFSIQGKLTAHAAKQLGLAKGTPLAYRAGDQPNNAFSLNVLNPGEVAATAGTSGVIYGVTDQPIGDQLSRVNTFVHVNHTQEQERYGVLLCINGTGIMNSWLRKLLSIDKTPVDYQTINQLAASVGIGSDGLCVLPFGNGVERVLKNVNIGASFNGIELTRHAPAHICRATQEGIVFSMGYGFEVLKEMGIKPKVIRVGYANMFLSEVFCETFTHVTGAELSLYNTDGSQGAARGAGVGINQYTSMEEAFSTLSCIKKYQPGKQQDAYDAAYGRWKEVLRKKLNQ